MNSNVESRIETRIDHKSYVLIKELQTGEFHRARMVNYCSMGMYLETDGLFAPQQEININIDNSPYTRVSSSEIFDCYHATIIWRRQLETGLYNFGYGLKIAATPNSAESSITS